MTKPRAAISWSGGKDSCAALTRARALFDVVAMVTMFDEEAARSRSHGLRPEVLAAQADRLGLRHVTGRCTWQTYDAAFSDALGRCRPTGSRTWCSATSCSTNIASGPSACARRTA